MSDISDFRIDFALFETRMQEDGYTKEDIEEVRQQVRDDWSDHEYRELWIAQVKKEADFMREIQAMAQGITNRIKSRKVKT